MDNITNLRTEIEIDDIFLDATRPYLNDIYNKAVEREDWKTAHDILMTRFRQNQAIVEKRLKIMGLLYGE